MTGEQHTNTRTLDRALDDAIMRLEKLGSKAAAKLIGRAQRYREQLAIWELQPPPRGQQDETTEEIMHLLSQAMVMTRGVSTPPPAPSEPPPLVANGDERPSRPDGSARDGKGVVIGRLKIGDKK